MNRRKIRIYICDLNFKAAFRGYGEGYTKEEAIVDALRIVRENYGGEGFYDYGHVCYRGDLN